MSKFILFFMTLLALSARAEVIYEGKADWNAFDRFMQERDEEDRTTGIEYLVSGAIATIGGLVGSSSTTDPLSQGAYAVTESVGIAAVGYGAAIYFNGNEYDSFYRAVSQSTSLTERQKTELLERFLEHEHAARQRSNWIRAGTHLLVAAGNFYSAAHENDKDVKNILNFLGGVNLVIGISYTF